MDDARPEHPLRVPGWATLLSGLALSSLVVRDWIFFSSFNYPPLVALDSTLAATGIVAGIGLLRRRRWATLLAMGFWGMSLVMNGLWGWWLVRSWNGTIFSDQDHRYSFPWIVFYGLGLAVGPYIAWSVWRTADPRRGLLTILFTGIFFGLGINLYLFGKPLFRL